jgi:hypothetical protein
LNGAWWLTRPRHALTDEPLAAARLIELVLANRVSVEPRRRDLLARDDIVVTEATPTGDALLDEVLERLAAADVHSCPYWIKRVAKGSEAAYWIAAYCATAAAIGHIAQAAAQLQGSGPG